MDTILRKEQPSMPLKRFWGHFFTSNHDYGGEHNSGMLEHRDKRPMLENVKTPQNGFSGTDIKSDLTTNNS
jgi:hypothetical protein